MNTTEYFKRTIQAYLEERAMEDELFAAKYDNGYVYQSGSQVHQSKKADTPDAE